jgi:hypothetical protein
MATIEDCGINKVNNLRKSCNRKWKNNSLKKNMRELLVKENRDYLYIEEKVQELKKLNQLIIILLLTKITEI